MSLSPCRAGILLPYVMIAGYCLLPGIALLQNKTTATSSTSLAVFDSLRRQNNLEDWLYRLRDYLEAEPAHHIEQVKTQVNNIWRKPSSKNEYAAWQMMLANLGYYSLYTGDIIGSVDKYEECLRSCNTFPPGGDFDMVEYILKPLGNNYTRLGDYERALFIQQKSLEIALQKKDQQQAASVYSNLAITSHSQGNLQNAMDWCVKGLKNVQQNQAYQGLLFSTFSEVLLEMKKIDSAFLCNQKALHLLQGAKDETSSRVQYWLMRALKVAGNIAKEKKMYAIALRYYRQAMEIADKFFKSERREKAKLLVATGDIYLQQLRSKEAELFFRNALQVLIPSYDGQAGTVPGEQMLYGENTLADALEGLSRALLLDGKNELSLEATLLSFYIDHKLSQQYFSIASKQLQQEKIRSKAEFGIGIAYNLWKKTNRQEYAVAALQIAEQVKSRVLLEEINRNLHIQQIDKEDSLLIQYKRLKNAVTYYEQQLILQPGDSLQRSQLLKQKSETDYKLSLLRKDIEIKFPVLRMQDTALADLTKPIRQIPGNVLLMEWFSGNSGYYIIHAGNEGIMNLQFLPDSNHAIRSSVQQFVNTFFHNGPTKMINDPEGYFKEAYFIYSQLGGIKTFERHKKQLMLVIPDGELGYLPFEALITGNEYNAQVQHWPYLFFDGPTWYAYSIQTWWSAEHKRQNPVSRFTGFFISQMPGQARLEAVDAEKKVLRNKISGQFFSNEVCQLKKFEEELSKSNVVHISTHAGFFTKDSVPGLQLYDVPFFIFQLNGLDQSPDLITLSACQTAGGMLRPGEGILSMARAFAATGTKGAVATLWDINDESSADLLVNFYKELAEGKDAVNALYEARLTWLQNAGKESQLALPYYWAGISYIGAIQHPVIERKRHNVWSWVIRSIFVVLIIYLIIRIKIKKN